jgi:hypothetical protein
MRMRLLLLAFVLIPLIACGTSGGGGDDDGERRDLHAPLGPVMVPASTENTQCVVLRLGNPTEIKVHQMHNVLGPGSHHLILYKDDMDTAEITTPFDCQPFTGALNLSGTVAPVMITQKPDDLLTLPDGVGYSFAPNQMVRIEMHYINATDATITAMATAEFDAADPATIQNEANILFIGSPDISIAPNASVDVHEFFTPSRASLDIDNAQFFASTGHTHKLGLDVQVSIASVNGGALTSVYDPQPFVWSEPETTRHNPTFNVPSGGGFDFKCSYHNSTSATVQFGESANNEMCFFWAYYYPSNGSHVCVHTTMFGGLDICCPDAGANVCNMLNRP